MRILYRELAEDHLSSTVSYNAFLLQKKKSLFKNLHNLKFVLNTISLRTCLG